MYIYYTRAYAPWEGNIKNTRWHNDLPMPCISGRFIWHEHRWTGQARDPCWFCTRACPMKSWCIVCALSGLYCHTKPTNPSHLRTQTTQHRLPTEHTLGVWDIHSIYFYGLASTVTPNLQTPSTPKPKPHNTVWPLLSHQTYWPLTPQNPNHITLFGLYCHTKPTSPSHPCSFILWSQTVAQHWNSVE